MKLSKTFKTAIYVTILLSLFSCGKKESPHRIGKFKVIDINKSSQSLSCEKGYVMYDDVMYTKADSNIKVGDSISIMYVPKTESYYIKENFPKNYNYIESVNDSTTRVTMLIFVAFIFLTAVYVIIQHINQKN